MRNIIRTTCICMLAFLAWLGQPTSGNAQQILRETPEQTKQRHEDEIRGCEQHLSELRAQMESFDQGGDPAAFYILLVDYLKTAHYLVYRAKASVWEDYELNAPDLESTNSDLTRLTGLGYIASWPANPLRNWAPMKVLAPADGFSPGDLVLDLCPPGEAATYGDQEYRVSFQLYVYGPDPDEAYIGASVGGGNEKWSSPPPGALIGAGMHYETEAERQERIAKLEKWFKEHPEDAPEPKD